MKAIVESFEGSGILVIHAKVTLQTTVLTTQFLEIKNQYECLVETMKSAKYTIKAVKAIQEVDFAEDSFSIN